MHPPILSPLRILASAFLVLGLVASRAHADTGSGPPASTIRVTGQASVTSRPDRAELDLGVVTRAETSQEAAAENARVVRNVLAALRGVLGPNAEIETISYTLQPDYQYPPQGGQPRITGYTATNVVRVTQDDLSRLGPVIDAATRAGANQVQRIRFTLKDEAAAKASALRLAALDARAKAGSLARALGLQIVRTRSVEETGPMPRPMYELAMARAEAPATPIIPGTIETTAMVTLTVDFGTPR
jgi:uncharacterized protein YggE